jgi:hypothetical protein
MGDGRVSKQFANGDGSGSVSYSFPEWYRELRGCLIACGWPEVRVRRGFFSRLFHQGRLPVSAACEAIRRSK